MQNLGTSGLFNLTLNYFPSISNIVVDNPINLIAGSTKIAYCNGTATDGDTFNDITRVNASLFYYQKQPNSPNNLSNHYTNSSCSLFNGIGNEINFICSFNLEYYANNGTWYCNATILDMINSTNTSQLSTTINDLLAIGITPGVIDFGALEILQISPSDIIVNVTNYGNIMLDLNLYGYAVLVDDNLSMDCTRGNISMEYERFSITQGQNYDLMTSINNSINAVFGNLNLPKREGGSTTESRKAVYWKLQIPMRTGGRCNGKVVFTALRG